MKKTVLFSFLIGLLLVLSYFLFWNQATSDTSNIKQKSNFQILSNLQPNNNEQDATFPFQELTILYLRQQTYQSSFADLQQVKNNNNLTGYTTSYQSDGLKINGYLAVPKGEPPTGGFPGVVLVHGYIPPQNYNTLSNYVSFADSLAAQGVVVFKTDLRGHGNSEGEAGGAYYSSDYIVDTLNAYNALQKASMVNPDKVGLWGHSMAGNVIVRAWAAQPTIPKIIVWAGAVYTYQDMADLGIDDNSYQPPAPDSDRQQRRDELFETHGRFSVDSEFWQQVPATNYLNEIEGAIQIHHAINDSVVSIEYSRNVVEIFDQAGIPNQLYEYQSGGHNITGNSFNQAIQRTADFLKE